MDNNITPSEVNRELDSAYQKIDKVSRAIDQANSKFDKFVGGWSSATEALRKFNTESVKISGDKFKQSRSLPSRTYTQRSSVNRDYSDVRDQQVLLRKQINQLSSDYKSGNKSNADIQKTQQALTKSLNALNSSISKIRNDNITSKSISNAKIDTLGVTNEELTAKLNAVKIKTLMPQISLARQPIVSQNSTANSAVNTATDVTAKLAKTLSGKTGNSVVNTATKASEVLSEFGGSLAVAGPIVAGLTASIVAMGAAGKYAYEQNMQVNNALMAVGASANELNKSSIDTSNNIIELQNSWKRAGEAAAQAFEPVFDFLIKTATQLGNAVADVSSDVSDTITQQRKYSESDSLVRWYSQGLQNRLNIPESTSLPVIGSTASSAKQSGFDTRSASNLAIATYDLALSKAKEYGLESQKVAEQLANAWLKGSDAAKDYGVVVNDKVLAGFMASKGIDIVNQEITDAMKQYYRFLLMQEEITASNSEQMQKNIKYWTQLGTTIDMTKNKLFSFDEVIQLSAFNADIPEVGTPNVNYDGKPQKSIPDTITGGSSGPGTPGLVTPVQFDYAVALQKAYQDIKQALSEPISIPIRVPDINAQLVPALERAYAYARQPVTVPVRVENPAPAFNYAVEAMRQAASQPVVVTEQVNGTEQVNEAVNAIRYLSAVHQAAVNMAVPGLNTVAYAQQLVHDVAQNRSATVNVKTLGLEALQQAKTYMEQVISLQNQVRSSMSSSWVNSYHTVSATLGTTATPSPTISSKLGTNLSSLNIKGVNASALQSAKQASNKSFNYKINSATEGNDLYTAPKSQPDMQTTYATPKLGSSISSVLAKTLNRTSSALGDTLGSIGSGLANSTAKSLSYLAIPAAAMASAMSLKYKSQNNFATGGIGTHEIHNATLFENNKKEAVIPLETQAGVDYLASAMNKANDTTNNKAGTPSVANITVNVNMSGVNTQNEAEMKRLMERVITMAMREKSRGVDIFGTGI